MLQQLFLTSPCCMGSVCFFASHVAWGRQNAFQQHLCNENATFSVFVTRPQREGRKSRILFFKKHEIQECAFGGGGEQHSVETPTPATQPTQPSEANNKTTTTINKFSLRTRKGSTSTSGKRFWSPRLSHVGVVCCICMCFHRRPLAV